MNTNGIGIWVIAAAVVVGSIGCAVLPPAGGCGCGDVGCAMEPGCGCEAPCDCGVGVCEPGCAVEPGCGAPCGCGPRGYDHALQRWCGCGDCEGPKLNVCTGPECGGGCGCGEATCAIEPGCGCVEPGCGCEPSCGVGGCGDVACGCGGNCVDRLGSGIGFGLSCIGDELRRVFRPVLGCTSCGGCDSECYWNEWHNDAPRCCDPCDRCGNWVGPTTSQRAPYDHEFSPRRVANEQGMLPKIY